MVLEILLLLGLSTRALARMAGCDLVADERGVVTAAFGRRKYVEMAVDLALSVKRQSSLPIAIVTDERWSPYISNVYNGVFDHVISAGSVVPLAGRKAFVLAKARAIHASPYRFSLFLDADMLCYSAPDRLLDGIDDETFRVSGTYHSAQTCGVLTHHAIPIAQLIGDFNLDWYAYTSLAAFAFGREGGRHVASLMLDSYEVWNKRMEQMGDVLNDEILIGMLGKAANLTFPTTAISVYQRLDLQFRWSDDFMFVHVAPMRHRESWGVLRGIVSRRIRSGVPAMPVLYWLSDILAKRADQYGRSRRQSVVVRKFAEWLFESNHGLD